MTYGYDADRRLTSVTEPTSGTATRTTSYSYYENSVMKELTDANGNVTHWDIDVESRPIKKTYASGTSLAQSETYTYEPASGRLSTVTDANGQTRTFAYDIDDKIKGIAYTGAINPTPNVTYAWDTLFPRLKSMTDGLGTTNFAYTAIGTAGALQLASIDGAFANDVIGLTYDSLGRLSGRTITGGNETFGYDAISRLTTHGTPLGSFTNTYLGQTGQMASRSVTNATVTVATNWGYDSNTNDRRLTTISNSGVTRSYTLGYGSGPVNPYDIMSITDTAATGHPFASQSHSYGYDNVDRLLSATSTTPGNYSYAYDNLDNATSVTDPGFGSTSPTYNGLNQVTAFNTNTYSYDNNGNTLSDGLTKNYKWDAENRLVEIDYIGSTAKSEFFYDGVGRRTVDIETDGTGNVITTRFLWCGARICQTRNGADTVQSRILGEGEYNTATTQKAIYMPDQLGSIRDVIDATNGNLIYSIDYSPYGKVTQSAGSFSPVYQFAGLMYHPQSALLLSATRALDLSQHWLNLDPIREAGGRNLYGYVDAVPTLFGDHTGLAKWDDPRLNNPAFTDPIFQGHPTYTPPACSATEPIWICSRPLGGQDSGYPFVCPLCHEFVACDDPSTTPRDKIRAFGKQPRALNPDGSSPPGSDTSGPGYISPEQYMSQPGDFSHCTRKQVCPSEKQRQCQAGPTRDPYETGSSVLNCQGWANGRSQ
jgi:RHS repeat-associated protein